MDSMFKLIFDLVDYCWFERKLTIIMIDIDIETVSTYTHVN